MGLLGVTLAAILDKEAGNSMPHGAPIYHNYLIVRGWTGDSDLSGFCQLPSAPHVCTRPGAHSLMWVPPWPYKTLVRRAAIGQIVSH